MPTDASVSKGGSRHALRRQAWAIIARSLLVSAVVMVGYFVLPLTSRLAGDSLVELLAGLVVIAGLLTWQIRAIVRSPLPAVEGMATLGLTVPMFLALFATTYFLMGQSDVHNFSEPLTRLDALYFTITAFATVGFGDITAVSEPARAVMTVQMVLGLILVGLIARVVVAAVEEARSHQRADRPAEEEDP